MMDSFHKEKGPCCLQSVIFCGKVDSNYCQTCHRWLEAPYDYIPRREDHTDCDYDDCNARDICLCQHNLEAHGRSLRLRSLSKLSEVDIEKVLGEFLSGPKNCRKCDCTEWE